METEAHAVTDEISGETDTGTESVSAATLNAHLSNLLEDIVKHDCH